MPVEKVNGLGVAYEVIGQGEPWAITPGGRFSKDVARRAGTGRGPGRDREAGPGLGPTQHRRVGGVLRR